MGSLSIRLLYLLEQFFSIYRNALRSLDSDFYLFSLYFKDGSSMSFPIMTLSPGFLDKANIPIPPLTYFSLPSFSELIRRC